MTQQSTRYWKSALLTMVAIILACAAVSAQERNSINANYGSRDPRTCDDKKAPANGAITAALALKYLNCQMESVSGGSLYLVENVKVQVGGGISYASIRGSRILSEIDVKHPVYPLRGSLVRYQCQNRLTAARVADANCNTYNEPQATGYCYKTTFGDWSCYMSDMAASNPENVHHDVPPPKGDSKIAGAKNQPENTKATTQKAGPKTARDTVERDENGFVKPDLSEMEQYFEVVKYEYNPLDGRVIFVVKAKKQTNIFRWYLSAYDADGVKFSETSFNGNVVTPEIGEPTRIYSFAPNEKDIRRVVKIGIARKLE